MNMIRPRARVRALAAALIAIAAAVGAAAPALADSANLTWTPPTQYKDGEPLPATDLDHYTISWAPAAGQAGPSGTLTVAGSLTSQTVPVACGQVSFTLTVTTTATAKYPNGTSGPAGPIAFDSAVQCTPNPPGGFAVTPVKTG